jgi:hypothetical protein
MEDRAERARTVLHVIAALSPSERKPGQDDTIPLDWFRWLPAAAARLLAPMALGGAAAKAPELATVALERAFGSQLASLQQVRGGFSVRVGWLFVAGHIQIEGHRRKIFQPLVSVPAFVERPKVVGSPLLTAAGDPQLTALITDRVARARLEEAIAYGGGALDATTDVAIPAALLGRLSQLKTFALDAAAAAGYSATRLIVAGDSPTALMRSDELVVVAGAAVYSAAADETVQPVNTWPSDRLDTETAFHTMYLDAPDKPDEADEPKPDRPVGTIGTAAVLAPAQRGAVLRSRGEAITVVSGAPGTGKSHTITAMATDAISRGESVLVAAKTDATVDALIDLLQRVPGPDPVVFGSSRRRDALATRLSAGQLAPESSSAVDRAHEISRRAGAAVEVLRAEIGESLRIEDAARLGDTTNSLTTVAPGFLDAGIDVDHLVSLGRAASLPAHGWLGRRRLKRVCGQLFALAEAPPDTGIDVLVEAVRTVGDRRRIKAVELDGGLDLGDRWDQLVKMDAAARDATGRWLKVLARSEDHLDRKALAAVSRLATALRSGRAARRAQLASFADDRLSQALPLWIGTLPDIDDLLPPVAQLFDLVILDESSSIEQRMAIPALLRARRAVVVGDPRQLRHVSFVSDDQVRTAIDQFGLGGDPALAAKLDVRRNSIFDVAAGVSVVTALDEHFRSDPHLIDFVGRRLYQNQFSVATRSPSTQSRDCVDVIRLTGQRDDNEVVTAEVERIVAELRTCLRNKNTSVGIVTPFRNQADALEAAVLAAFTTDELEALDLRVGTVHGFQGNERDLMYCSLGIDGSDGSPWTFVNDPHLLAVFLTRARRQLVFVHSADPPAGSLLAQYLAAVDQPPGPPAPSDTDPIWADSVLDDLQHQGVTLYRSYPVGRHVIDAAVSVPGRNTALLFNVHRDGPDAHVERQLALRHGGWQVIEALPSRWAERPAELTIDLLARLR